MTSGDTDYTIMMGTREQKLRIAAAKKVVVASTTIVQQCLNACLLDEIHIDAASLPVGIRFRGEFFAEILLTFSVLLG
jgi:hypothetical protein